MPRVHACESRITNHVLEGFPRRLYDVLAERPVMAIEIEIHALDIDVRA